MDDTNAVTASRQRQIARNLEEGTRRFRRLQQRTVRQRRAAVVERLRLRDQRERARVHQCIQGYEDILKLTGVKAMGMDLVDREGYALLHECLLFVLGLHDQDEVKRCRSIVTAIQAAATDAVADNV